MVIHAKPSGATAFLIRREIADKAKIIVRPDDRDVLRYLQSALVEFEDFLVGTEHLGHLLNLWPHMALQQIPLIREEPLQRFDAFRIGAWSHHVGIMNPAHPDRVDVFETAI